MKHAEFEADRDTLGAYCGKRLTDIIKSCKSRHDLEFFRDMFGFISYLFDGELRKRNRRNNNRIIRELRKSLTPEELEARRRARGG